MYVHVCFSGHLQETKAQLATMTKKYQVAREEGEQIRSDMKKMIAEYQTSEEMRSNSLDVKLRKTEEELRQQEQEIVDQQQLHELTVKDLDITRASLEISQKECQQLKTRVSTCMCWRKKCAYSTKILEINNLKHPTEIFLLMTEHTIASMVSRKNFMCLISQLKARTQKP